MNSKKTPAEYYAEAFREMGILIMVFGPMYCVFDTKDHDWILALSVIGWFISGLVMFNFGILLERKIT